MPAMNKSGLNQLRGELATFERFLPTLELRRQQLLAEASRAAAHRQTVGQALAEARAAAQTVWPMLGYPDLSLSGLVEVHDVVLEDRNIVGTVVPQFQSADIRVAPYSRLARPHWVDTLVDRLVACAELELQMQVADEAHRRLQQAVAKITQRVNLFEKVLIPDRRAQIAKIRVFLADAERMAVVRSKIAKRKLEAR